ncbi:hypothetical protein ELQ87_04700 [Streptomyces griseoviridis]|uniref:Uncharacterized protein n=1 Tax=Streptomyces griseoviridis TaxID=45398 RepID=A0A3S9Z7F7_STRGD|nr:DUF5994 family protein [Streptomyces griseoviridis]AZS83672.1 hypothetical protein ELQ87_04700 [Streptomyces griseoviridis]QCN90929.1 hypothetical protein DDJ31_34655 [Streptomyces griseoviridis]
MITVRLLADTCGVPVVPGTAVLRWETTATRTGAFDGAWWPRNRDLASQLSELLDALTARLGPLARVGLDASDWDETPGHVHVGDHMVRVDWSAVSDNTMIVTRGEQDHFLFLVIPPGTRPGPAHAAMEMAVRDGNALSAEQILTVTGVRGPVRTGTLHTAPG